jgi:hypothetical protein
MDDDTYSQPSPRGFEVVHLREVVATYSTRHEADAHVLALTSGMKASSPNIPSDWREDD